MKYKWLVILVMIITSSLTVSAQNTLDQAAEFIPSFSGLGLVFIIFFGIILGLIALGVGLYFFIRWLKFNRHITIWEDVEGHDDLEPVGTDKAMLVKTGKGGTQLLYLRKRKVHRGAYGKRIGAKKYLFVIGKDGYWYNSTLGSLEEGMRKINIKPTSVNMRYQNEALMEIIRQREDQPSFWAQYGQILVNIAFFMLIAVMFWLYFSTFKDTAGVMGEAAQAIKEGAEALRQSVSGLHQLRDTGGFAPA